MIKRKLLLVAILVAGLILPTAVQAGFRVEIGDSAFFTHGERYWDGDWEMYWVPGHYSHRRHGWVHGHYARGEHRRNNWRNDDNNHNNNHHNDHHNNH